MKLRKLYIAILISLSTMSCDNEDWLQRDPKNIITNEQLWNDPQLIASLMANFYDRLPSMHGVFNTGGMCEIDDAMWSGHPDQNWRNDFNYGDDYGRYWDYGFIRDINLSLDNIEKYGTELSSDDKTLYTAELRFIRAFVYFELVKRMGGVPIVTEQLIYDFNGDPSYLQIPRAKEHEVYDFIYSELEAIKGDLAANNSSQTRANTYVALALESRAMLYAGSIAKYNNLMASPITTPGGEVGIPAGMANDYYTKSLEASQTILKSGQYSLYNTNSDKGRNFYDMTMAESDNKEVIFAKDFIRDLKGQWFTFDNILRSFTQDNEGSSMISPSLNLVESFDYLDGSPGTLHDKDGNGDYIVYDEINGIYEGKDGRLYGTVIFPGTNFQGNPVNIQAGVAIPDGNGSYEFRVAPNLGENYTDGGTWTGMNGPQDGGREVSNTGFYLRKMVSEAPGASNRGNSDNWWPWFRLGETYLNAAEAAFELGSDGIALEYINTLRERAGFPENSLSSITMDDIRKERRVELAFEDHRFFDLKRWRIAHIVWDGTDESEDAVVYGLYPYRIVDPGQPDDGKYIYERLKPSRFRRPRFFRLANYYASIEPAVLSNNPKLVKNPYH